VSEVAQDILLVVSTLGCSEESAAYAIDQAAAAGSRLHLLLVCEPDPQDVAERLSEESWIGDRQGSELSAVISRDRRTRGYRELSGIARDAATEEVVTVTQVVEGELLDEVRRYALANPMAQIVLSLPAPGILSRILPGRKDKAARLEGSLGIPVRVFHYS